MAHTSAAEESARFWRPPGLSGVDLLEARYVRKSFARHTHDTYVIAAVTEGVEAFRLRSDAHTAGAGGLVLVNPDTPHTGHAGVPEGWRYSVLYPDVALVEEVARETTAIDGTPGFPEPVVHDPPTAGMVQRVHRAAEAGDPLAADTLMRAAFAVLLRRHAGPLPRRTVRGAGARTAEEARAILRERMTAPPTLEELARELGTGTFALLRRFRAEYGMPPHAWLTDARVRAARTLLDEGMPPAQVAAAVGFSDQSHLGRHFARIVGVPPGAYARGRGRAPRARTYKTAPVAPA